MRSEKSFFNILEILEILKEYTDESNGLTATQIKERINKKNGEVIIKKTETVSQILDKLLTMEVLDYYIDILDDSQRYKHYYVERSFSFPEVVAIINLIKNSQGISQKHSNEMIKKMHKGLSVHQKKYLSHNVLGAETLLKTPNMEMLRNIEEISLCLRNCFKLEFDYCKYSSEKKLVISGRRRVVIPYGIVIWGGNHYLVGKECASEVVKTFRVDKIVDIKETDIILSEDEIAERDAYDVSAHAETGTFMHMGDKREVIELMCIDKPGMKNGIIENFKDAKIIPAEDGKFQAIVKANADGFVFWALQYSTACWVVSPEHLKERIRKELHEAYLRYSVDT